MASRYDSWCSINLGSVENVAGNVSTISCKEGYLIKQGGRVKNWKKRWFVVQNDHMAYYENKDSTKPQKVWDLKTLLNVKECACENKRNTFCLMFVDRTMFCVADTPIKMEEWISFFQGKIDDFKKQILLDSY